jgi:hypothetical protein
MLEIASKKEPYKTYNPYVHYGHLLVSRIIWDFHLCSWLSRKRLRQWKDRFIGQKAIILCNGPSLNKVDFDEINSYRIFTFGMNKINLLFDRTEFRPSAIVAVNPYVISQNAEFYNQTDLPLFIDSCGHNKIKLRRNVHFIHSAAGHRKFARDCSISVVRGATVTFIAMQLAFHMGFKQVALVGCDHSFTSKGTANSVVKSGEIDLNHFSENYFSKGVKWQLPDLLASELQYDTAKSVFEKYGKKIVNCTDKGKLEIFERITLTRFLND